MSEWWVVALYFYTWVMSISSLFVGWKLVSQEEYAKAIFLSGAMGTLYSMSRLVMELAL